MAVISLLTGVNGTENKTKNTRSLLDSYFNTVGNAGNLILDIGPDPSGAVPSSDVAAYREFGDAVKCVFQHPVGPNATNTSFRECSTNSTLSYCWGGGLADSPSAEESSLRGSSPLLGLVLREDISHGQLIDEWALDVASPNQAWTQLATGRSIGAHIIVAGAGRKGLRPPAAALESLAYRLRIISAVKARSGAEARLRSAAQYRWDVETCLGKTPTPTPTSTPQPPALRASPRPLLIVEGGNASCCQGSMGGGALFAANLTLSDAAAWCANNSKCFGWTALTGSSLCPTTGLLSVSFKDSWGAARINANDKTHSSWYLPPPPPPSYVCEAGNCIAGVGRVSYTRSDCFGQCKTDDGTAVTVDLGSARPLAHYWKRCFGSGHAALTLRQDWRDALTAAVDELGLSGVRHHGLLDDDMGVVIGRNSATGKYVYNFSKISSSWDYQVALGVSPVVELSFMPAFLANCTWHKYDTGNSLPVAPVVNPGGNGSCVTGNFYSGGNMLPKHWDDWYELVHALVSHAVKRYGLAVVQSWHFEVWVREQTQSLADTRLL